MPKKDKNKSSLIQRHKQPLVYRNQPIHSQMQQYIKRYIKVKDKKLNDDEDIETPEQENTTAPSTNMNLARSVVVISSSISQSKDDEQEADVLPQPPKRGMAKRGRGGGKKLLTRDTSESDERPSKMKKKVDNYGHFRREEPPPDTYEESSEQTPQTPPLQKKRGRPFKNPPAQQQHKNQTQQHNHKNQKSTRKETIESSEQENEQAKEHYVPATKRGRPPMVVRHEDTKSRSIRKEVPVRNALARGRGRGRGRGKGRNGRQISYDVQQQQQVEQSTSKSIPHQKKSVPKVIQPKINETTIQEKPQPVLAAEQPKPTVIIEQKKPIDILQIKRKEGKIVYLVEQAERIRWATKAELIKTHSEDLVDFYENRFLSQFHSYAPPMYNPTVFVKQE